MPSPQGPLLPRRRLGAELRRLRGDRDPRRGRRRDADLDVQVEPTGERAGRSPAPRHPRSDQLLRAPTAVTADRLRRWTERGPPDRPGGGSFRTSFRTPSDPFLDFESGASVIRTYAPMILPGLLQTEAYATQPDHDTLPALHDRAGRQARPATPASPGDPPERDEDATRLLAVIDEAAIRRALAMGTAATHAPSSSHLREISAPTQRLRSASCPSTPAFMPESMGIVHRIPVLRRHRPRRRQHRNPLRRPLPRGAVQRPRVSTPLRRRLPSSARQHRVPRPADPAGRGCSTTLRRRDDLDRRLHQEQFLRSAEAASRCASSPTAWSASATPRTSPSQPHVFTRTRVARLHLRRARRRVRPSAGARMMP